MPRLVTVERLGKDDANGFRRCDEAGIAEQHASGTVLGASGQVVLAPVPFAVYVFPSLSQQPIDVVGGEAANWQSHDGSVLHVHDFDISVADGDLALRHQDVDATGGVGDNGFPHVKAIFDDHVAGHEERSASAEPAVLVRCPGDIRAVDAQCNKFADLTNPPDSAVVSGWRVAVGAAIREH